MLIYTTKTAAFTQSLFYVFCLNFSAYTPQSWKLLCSVCVTDDSSTDSAPERLRRHAEWAELNQHTRNVQNKINGTVKLPIYHKTEIKTGGGDPAYILVFCYPHWLSKVCACACMCVCVCIRKGDRGRGRGLCVDYVQRVGVRGSCVENLWLCSCGGKSTG